MLHVAPRDLSEAHSFAPLPSPNGEVIIRFDGRMRRGHEPEIFAVIPLEGLARSPAKILAELERIAQQPESEFSPVFRQTHSGPSLYLPLEDERNETLFARFREMVPTLSVEADLRFLFGSDGMGAFREAAAFEAPFNDFKLIDTDVALDLLKEARLEQIRSSALKKENPDLSNDAPTLS